MKEYSIGMALFDLVPVILFTIGSVILQREFYERMTKGPFALFAAGTIDIAAAGFCKALYKFLYATGICDFNCLSVMFFPFQSIGFLLAGISMISLLRKKTGMVTKVYSVAPVAPVLWKGTFLFVGLMVGGLGLMDFTLIKLCIEDKKKKIIPLFIISFICSLAMGYLSSKDFSKNSMNWIAEIINSAGQCAFMLGAMFFHKKETVENKEVKE